MQQHSLTELADAHLEQARAEESGISGFDLGDGRDAVQQTIVALTAGQRIEVNHSPQYATALVMRGDVSMRTAQGPTDGGPGAFFVVSGEPHSVTSVTDSVLLITVTPA